MPVRLFPPIPLQACFINPRKKTLKLRRSCESWESFVKKGSQPQVGACEAITLDSPTSFARRIEEKVRLLIVLAVSTSSIMHGSIWPVIILPEQFPGQVQLFEPRSGEFFEAVQSRGNGMGQIKNNFSLILQSTCMFLLVKMASWQGLFGSCLVKLKLTLRQLLLFYISAFFKVLL